MKGYVYVNADGEYARMTTSSGFSQTPGLVFGSLNQATVFTRADISMRSKLERLHKLPAEETRTVKLISESELGEF